MVSSGARGDQVTATSYFGPPQLYVVGRGELLHPGSTCPWAAAGNGAEPGSVRHGAHGTCREKGRYRGDERP
eukprot:7113397-Prymnesium_polylepis.1